MNDTDFQRLCESIKQAGEIRRGERTASRKFKVISKKQVRTAKTSDAAKALPHRKLNVKRIRESLGLSQSDFSTVIGVSTKTLQNWEQGRREPQGPAKALLQVVEVNPSAVLEALHR